MMNRFITGVNILLVILVAIGSFVLSYSALSDLASKNGFSDWRAYVLPLVIDVGMLAFGLAVVHAHLHGTNPIRRRGLNLTYIIATTTFNIVHAPNNLLAQTLAALPPVTLFFAFEVLMSQVETGLRSKTQTVDVGSLQDELSWQQERVKELEAETAEMQEIFDTGNAESKQVHKQLTALKDGLEEVKGKLQSSEDERKRLKDRLKAAEERVAIAEGLSKFTGLLSDKAEDRVHTARALWPDNSQAFISKAANVSESFTSQVLKANGNGKTEP